VVWISLFYLDLTLVLVSEDGLKVKREAAVPENLSFDGRIVVLGNFPPGSEQFITKEKIQALFPGEKNNLLSCRVIRDLKKGKPS
jgi:hypothetical protein